MIPNQISARLSHDPEVGVKWMGYAGRHGEQGITGPAGPTRAKRTRTPQCAFIHRPLPNARRSCRSWAAEIVLGELAAASFAVEADGEAVLVGADDGLARQFAVPRCAGGHNGVTVDRDRRVLGLVDARCVAGGGVTRRNLSEPGRDDVPTDDRLVLRVVAVRDVLTEQP
jgi:hypothetical protein